MSRQDDEEIIAAAREGFLDEAREMLAQFERALLVMEEDPADAENLNAAFRAAHTIKGTAGLFGFERVVAFTHEAETLLECLRAGQIAVDERVAALLLQSRDQIEHLLDEVRTGEENPALAERSRTLGAALRAVMGAPAAADDVRPAGPGVHEAGDDAPAGESVGDGCWHLSLRFGADALRNGLDPLAFIRYLPSVGAVRGVKVVGSLVPTLEELDPENCHLGFELRVDGAPDEASLLAVFEFCADDCDIAILSPGASAADHAALLERRTGGDDAARAELLALWSQIGLELPLRRATAGAAVGEAVSSPDAAAGDRPAVEASTVPAAPSGDAPVAVPQIERRVASAPTDRRENEPERRTGGKDRRAGDETRFIRVRADKLDRLIDLIGELVIASSGAQLVASQEDSPSFGEASQRIHDLVQEARDGALGLRMVPIGETFSRFHRVVRDVCKQLGKDVDLQITGGDTELDKSMVETIADPLMHLVRNSLDHGIEPAEDRAAAGKSPQGRLALHAYHESGSIVIEVSDDGRGLNRDRILAKAVERGLVAPDAVLDDEQVHQLIFAPGFSTADAVTNLSGRGVGMDVVKRNIESLRGQIKIASQAGRGTTMQVRLPLTLAIIDGFLTSVGGVSYVLPLELVAECLEVPEECDGRTDRIAGHFDLRGEVLPYLDLGRFYRHPLPTSGRRSLVLVRDGSSRVGLVVDRLHGEHQTVIKPLGQVFQHIRGLAGSTILGSGEVALILDVPALLTRAAEISRSAVGDNRTGRTPAPHAVHSSAA